MRKRNNIPAVLLAVFGFMACIGLAVLYGTIHQYIQVGALVSRGKQAQATISSVWEHSKGKGRYAKYSFPVDGQTIEGQDDYQGGYDDKGPITITFLPEDPTVSSINPDAKLTNTRFGIAFGIVWLSLLGSFGWIAARSKTRASKIRVL